MRIILDTNVFIVREDHKELSPPVQQLLKLIAENRIQVVRHPGIDSDIARDKNEARKAIILSKLSAYPALEGAPDSARDVDFAAKVGPIKTANDKIDNDLLLAICRNAVDFLVSEDLGLHQKSRILLVSDRVFTIAEAISFFVGQFTPSQIRIPAPLISLPAHELSLKDPLFDSLKADYQGFGAWWAKISKQGRKPVVLRRDDGTLGALYLHKLEDEAIPCDPPLPRAQRLKICALKVEDTGYKLGELFLKLAIDFAMANTVPQVYFTHVVIENDPLIALTQEFGFKDVGKLQHERVFLKTILPVDETLPASEFCKTHFPCFRDGPEIRKFLVPILPEYHEKLFPGFEKVTLSLFDGTELSPEGNAVKKAYLCNSNTTKVRPGDLLLFYRSQDEQCVTAIGSVETVRRNSRNPIEILRLVGKRTVYSAHDVTTIAESDTSLVILFLFHSFLPNRVTLDDLQRNRVISGAPMSISQLDHKQYQYIKKAGRLDGRLTFN